MVVQAAASARGLWRPRNLAGAVIGQVGDVAGARGGHTSFDRSVWLFARTDTIEEVLQVVDGAVAEAVGPYYWIFPSGQAFVINGEAAAVDLQGGVGASELEASIVDGGGHHSFVDDVESGIAEGRLHGVGALPLFEDGFVGEELRVRGLIGFHGPVSDVDPMGEEIGHRAAAKVPKPAPTVELFFAEGLIGSAAEPLLPIERLDVNGSVFAPPEIVLPPIRANLRNAAEAAALNEVYGIAEVAPTALLHPALEDLSAGTDGTSEGRAFLNSMRDRLFQIDIFAGGDGVHGHAHVPMVGRSDDDSVEFLLEELAIIVVDGRETFRTFLDGIPARSIDFADGGDLVVGAGLVGGVKETVHAAASANDADADGVVGAEDASGRQSGQTGSDDETATIELVCHGQAS